MLKSAKRFLTFGFYGTLCMVLWAAVIGYVVGFSLAYFAPSGAGKELPLALCCGMALLSLLPSLLSFGIGGLAIPEHSGRQHMLKFIASCGARSLVLVLVFGVLGGLLEVTVVALTKPHPISTYGFFALGFLMGTLCGFTTGLIWGVIATVRSIKSGTEPTESLRYVPPIAMP